MTTTGAQYEHCQQAPAKELQAFLKTAWMEPAQELRSRYFAAKKKIVMQLLVFSLKPMTAEKKALGLLGDKCEKARICLQGQNHEGFKRRTLPPMLMHIFFLCFLAGPEHVLASFDVSNAS